ncbi:MAG: 4Fe-4S binding protein [Firmicutes bacterium]|nr:4Fe-4S binding protein [Bacillota bacterium]
MEQTKKQKDINKKKNTPASRRKKQQKLQALIRFAVQVLFFVLFPSAYASSFAGVKYIFTQIGAHQMIEFTPFIAILITLCAYTVLFGRFFCGYVCAFGSVNDWIFWLHKTFSDRRGKKPAQIPDKVMANLSILKYLLLAVIIVLCVLGKFGVTGGWSPWDAFSQIRAGQFTSLSGYLAGCALLGVLLIGMFFSERFFCRTLCPMGGVFSLLPVLPWLTVRRDQTQCIAGCRACAKACPALVSLPDMESLDTPGDCFQCHKCTCVCPRSNVTTKVRWIRGDDLWLTMIRVLILAGLFIWLGV